VSAAKKNMGRRFVMRSFAVVSCCLALLGGTASAVAAACPGNPNALGTSRVLTIGNTDTRLGTMQYRQTLPLADHEVVLSFDDGPLPPYTNRVLDALAAECVKATYFLVGRQANANPDLVRQIYNAGHTIGTHSQNHPLTFDRMSEERAEREINDGIATIGAALGDPKAVAPFFRIPGLLRVKSVENYLASRSIVTWSADFVADDWYKQIAAKEVLRRALARLEAKGRGILLLHDIQPATALMLPALLKELKARGYRVVQVVPAGAERPKNIPMVSSNPGHQVTQPKQGWPRVTGASSDPPVTAPAPISGSPALSAPETMRPPAKRLRKKVADHRGPATTSSVRHPRLTAERGWEIFRR
jgi:peptidoglycan/xylan/chitin deacetylase (PgdA/CDA1 family)